MLTSPTLAAAAAECGIPASSLRRWLSDDDNFRAALSEAQGRVLDDALYRLHSLVEKALETLERNMGCGVHGVETRAALGVLQFALKRCVEVETESRLAELEKLLRGFRG